jgi:hypothetical protein
MDPVKRPPANVLLDSSDPDAVRGALAGLAGGLLGALNADLEDALRGSIEATRRYVRGYQRLTQLVLADVTEGRILATDERREGTTGVLAEVVEHSAAEAPFSPWATQVPLGDAVALELANRVRTLMGSAPLTAPSGAPDLELDPLAAKRFLRSVRRELDEPDPLSRLMRAFDVSKPELAGWFGVSRQAVDKWLGNGAPADRQEKVATLLALTDLLERKLKADRLPGVARRSAPAYGGLTMLKMIEANKERELLAITRASFDWSNAA